MLSGRRAELPVLTRLHGLGSAHFLQAVAGLLCRARITCQGGGRGPDGVYLPHSNGAGLKLRGGGGWEVKLLEDTDERGWKWKKHRCCSELEAVAKAGSSAATRVTVQKRRLQTSVSGCVAEQTDLVVSCGGAEEEWQTVAVEGKRSACLPLLQELLLACEAQCDPA